MKNVFFYLCVVCGLLAFSSKVSANQCNDIFNDIFTHGLASHSSSGKVTFESESLILSYVHSTDSYYYPSSYPSRKLDFKSRTDNTKFDNPKSCGGKRCTKTDKKTPKLDQLGDFQPSTSSNNQQISTEVTLPAGDYGNIQVRNHGVLTLSGGNGIYRIKNLDVEQGGEIYFSSGVYFIEKLHIKHQAKAFHLDDGTSVLYVNTTAVMDSESRFNRFKRASNILLFANGNVSFNHRSQSRMFVYSKGQVNIEQDAFLKGAVNAQNVHMKHRSTLYWDLEASAEIDRCSSGVDQSGEATLVGHWNANVCNLTGAQGEVVDIVGGNNGQSRANASIDVNGKFCQALRFNGDNANVLIPHSADFALASGSVAFWFKTSDLSHSSNRGYGGQGLWSKDSSGWDAGGDHLTIWLKSDGAIRVRHQNDQGSSDDISLLTESHSVQENQWHHLVYTWGSQGSYLYLDGEGEELRRRNDDDDDDDGGDDDDDGGDDDDDGGDDDDDGGDDDDDGGDNGDNYSSEIRSLANNPEPIVVGANAWTTENYGSSNNLKDYFRGQIDDIRLYAGQLTLDETEALYEMDNPDSCLDCPVAEPELVAQYSADTCGIDGNGGTYVDSVNGYNGMFYNGVEARSGKFCNSVYFNGDDEYISIPHVQEFNIAQGAIALWVLVPDLTFENRDGGSHSGQTLFSKDSQGYDNGGKHLTMWVQSDGSIRVRHQTTNNNNLYNVNSSAGAISQGQWHHVMYTWGENGKRLYIDGALASNLDGFSPGIETNPEPIVLGASATLTGNSVSEEAKLNSWFKGKLDDVRIYGSAQPDDSFVAAVATDEVSCLQCGEPIAHYKFEGSSAVAFESSTGQYNGTEFPEGQSGITFLHGSGTASTLGSCQVMSVPDNGNDDGIGDVDSNDEGVLVRQAMDSGIDPDDIGVKGTISFWYQANENWGNGRPRQLFDGSDETNGGGGGSKYFHGTMLRDGKIRFGMEDSRDGDGRIDTTAAFTFAAGTWVHLAFVWDFSNASSQTDANMRIFVNGAEQPFNYVNNSINEPSINFESTIFFGDNRTDQYHVGLSTGNSANGQFDDIRVYDDSLGSAKIVQDMADVTGCRFGLSRYQIEFPATAPACSATNVTVRACEDSNCQYLAVGQQEVRIIYEYANGDTEFLPGPLVLINGLGSVSFTPERSGIGTFRISEQAPVAELPYQCNPASCQINYGNSQVELNYLVDGLVSADTPVKVAEQAFSVDSNSSLVLKTPGTCQLSESVPVEIAVECIEPAICSSRNMDILIPGSTNVIPVNPVDKLTGGGQISDTDFVEYNEPFTGAELAFDNLRYNDAGEIRLHIKVAGQVFSRNVVVKPAYLRLSSELHSADGTESVTTAGDSFNMSVAAFGINDSLLPNYQPGDLQFSMERITPEQVTGSTNLSIVNPSDAQEVLAVSDSSTLTQFSGNSFNVQPQFNDGESAPMNTTMPEVGRFAIDVRDANYLQKGSDLVGIIPSELIYLSADSNDPMDLNDFVFARFKPAKFDLEATVDYTAPRGSFAFRGEPLEADDDGTAHRFLLTARNSLGQITRYYDAGTPSRNVENALESFLAGEPLVGEIALSGEYWLNGDIRVRSLGSYSDANNTGYSIWAIANRNSFPQTVNLTAEDSSGWNIVWQKEITIEPDTEVTIASLGRHEHQVSIGALGVYAFTPSGSSYEFPTSEIATGGSFKFNLASNEFDSREYTAWAQNLTGEPGSQTLQESLYPHIDPFEGTTQFINDTLSDGIFEFRLADDALRFIKYFGKVQGQLNGEPALVERAQPPVVNGIGDDLLTVRLNLPTSLFTDGDGVGVALADIIETSGKGFNYQSTNGVASLVINNLLDTIEVRSGRIRLVNSVTAELDTEVGIVSEYYAGDNDWRVNELDDFISYDSANLAIRYVQNTISGIPILGSSGVFDKGIGDGADAMTITIGGFTGENNSGEVDLGYNIPADLFYLQYYWCGENSASTNHQNNTDGSNPNETPVELVSCLNPIGQYTFGLERGNDRVIHWREVLK